MKNVRNMPQGMVFKWCCSLALIGFLLCQIACDGGNSSETVGLRTGVTVTPSENAIQGRANPGNWVGLYEVDYQPQIDSGFADTLMADDEGRFQFGDLLPGEYNILVRGYSDSSVAFLAKVKVSGIAIDTIHRVDFDAPGSITGRIGDSTNIGIPLVYLPGTPFSIQADSTGHYLCSGIPVGKYRIVKTWVYAKPCDPGKVCGGAPQFGRDSTELKIQSSNTLYW